MSQTVSVVNYRGRLTIQVLPPMRARRPGVAQGALGRKGSQRDIGIERGPGQASSCRDDLQAPKLFFKLRLTRRLRSLVRPPILHLLARTANKEKLSAMVAMGVSPERERGTRRSATCSHSSPKAP